jgi:CBS domain-containing protein
MDLFEYSKKTLLAFIAFLVGYGLLVGLLWMLAANGLFPLSESRANENTVTLLLSLPFVALYLVVLLGATAGYARSQIMADKLPLNKMLASELGKRTMNGASIRTTVRNAAKLSSDDTLPRAITTIVSSRLPILPVVDTNDRVIGVVSHSDLARRIQSELDADSPGDLDARLRAAKISTIMQSPPVVASSDETLSNVVERMLKEQFIRLVVVENEAGMKLSGTIDMLDLVGEVYKGNGDE